MHVFLSRRSRSRVYCAVVGGVFTGVIGVTGFIGIIHLAAWQLLVRSLSSSGPYFNVFDPFILGSEAFCAAAPAGAQTTPLALTPAFVFPRNQYTVLLLLKSGCESKKFFRKLCASLLEAAPCPLCPNLLPPRLFLAHDLSVSGSGSTCPKGKE